MTPSYASIRCLALWMGSAGNRDPLKSFRRHQALGWRRKPVTAPEVQYHRNATHPAQDDNSSKKGGETFFLIQHYTTGRRKLLADRRK